MPTFSGYCAATDVKTNAIAKVMTDASWSDANIESRITEADDTINAELKGMGFTLPFSSVPPIIKWISVYLSRYNCLRDLFQDQAAYGTTEEKALFERWKKLADDLLKGIKDGTKKVVDSTGAAVAFNDESLAVMTNTADVARAMTMGPDEDQGIDPENYSDDVLGNP